MTGWDDAAACRGRETRIWFDQHTVDFAISVCRRCPVARQCLAEALDRSETCGVWGGVDLTSRAGRRVGRTTRTRLRAQLELVDR